MVCPSALCVSDQSRLEKKVTCLRRVTCLALGVVIELGDQTDLFEEG